MHKHKTSSSSLQQSLSTNIDHVGSPTRTSARRAALTAQAANNHQAASSYVPPPLVFTPASQLTQNKNKTVASRRKATTSNVATDVTTDAAHITFDSSAESNGVSTE